MNRRDLLKKGLLASTAAFVVKPDEPNPEQYPTIPMMNIEDGEDCEMRVPCRVEIFDGNKWKRVDKMPVRLIPILDAECEVV